MKRILMTAVIATAFAATPAFAANNSKKIDGRDQLPTETQTKLDTAMKDQGCQGGTVSQEDDNIMVKGTTCGEGTYDLMFDSNFDVTKNESQ